MWRQGWHEEVESGRASAIRAVESASASLEQLGRLAADGNAEDKAEMSEIRRDIAAMRALYEDEVKPCPSFPPVPFFFLLALSLPLPLLPFPCHNLSTSLLCGGLTTEGE